MRDVPAQCCITRLVDGDNHDLQLAQLQAVMQRIQLALRDVPLAQRAYLGNALLNLAINRILSEEGSQRTASILLRLSDVLHTHSSPPGPAQVINLMELHG
ncbi:MAG: hypothetical protein QM808_12095 [Steroidobacteraceae bacterium]